MAKFGLDLGSTFSAISEYKIDKKLPEVICLTEGASPYIPSVVTERKGVYKFGTLAKKQVGKSGVKTYKGFKMLFPEVDPEKLASRGYQPGDENTVGSAKYITRLFLDNVISQALSVTGGSSVDKLVICTPEIWGGKLEKVDARSIIRRICTELPTVDEGAVQVVSEPAAASAFFAHNYFLNKGVNYNGKLLLIDYGGGTLDITLTDVAAGRADSGESMEIRVLTRDGAGENVSGQIGEAGIIYMESLMRAAILSSGAFDEEPDLSGTNEAFLQAVDDLEAELQNNTAQINKTFSKLMDLDEDEIYEELEDKLFVTIDFDDQEIDVTYAMIRKVYMDVIYPVLNRYLVKIEKYMKEHKYPYDNKEQDWFKIVLVGGFGTFYLVREQVHKFFDISEYDRRVMDIIRNQNDCQQAIALGAALLANGIIGLRKTAPYSIGIWGTTLSGKEVFCYGIHCGQEIEENKIYMSEAILKSYSSDLKNFVYNSEEAEGEQTREKIILKKKYADRLKGAITSESHSAMIGFSLDSSDIVSVHIFNCDHNKKVSPTPALSIELSSIYEMMEDHIETCEM